MFIKKRKIEIKENKTKRTNRYIENKKNTYRNNTYIYIYTFYFMHVYIFYSYIYKIHILQSTLM